MTSGYYVPCCRDRACPICGGSNQVWMVTPSPAKRWKSVLWWVLFFGAAIGFGWWIGGVR